MNQRTDVYSGRASVPAGLDEPTQQLPTLTELTEPVGSVAYAASRLADGDVPDELVAGLAETVADWLRGLTDIDQSAPIPQAERRAEPRLTTDEPCPPWCTVDHDAIYEDALRECSAPVAEIRTLTDRTLDVGTVLFRDLVTGQVRPPEVRVGDDTVTPAEAFRLADAILVAAAIARTGSVRDVATAAEQVVAPSLTGACRPWCISGDASCGGECLSEGTWIGATRGAVVLTDVGAKIPRIETNASINERGEVGVHLSIHGPINSDSSLDDNDRAAWASMSPAEARKLAAAILREADRVEGVTR